MYVFDTGILIILGYYYPSQFPTVWERISELAKAGKICSVREVKREIEFNCQHLHVLDWVSGNSKIFLKPTEEELRIVSTIFKDARFRGLVKKRNILDGKPVADPFVIAAAKVKQGCVVTQETFKPDGARIPTVCKELSVECIDLEEFLNREKLKY